MSRDLVTGGVVELNGKRYGVNQFNQTLHIYNIMRRWSGCGMKTVYRDIDRKGATFAAVAAAYRAQKEEA